jgi:hypothetical protein
MIVSASPSSDFRGVLSQAMHGGEQASYSSGGSLKFGLPITSILNSVVTLTVNADAVTLVDNVSPGKILSAQVCQFNNATCGSFQALTQRGYLTATVQNAGSIAAAFIVSVRHASVSFRMTLRLTSERERHGLWGPPSLPGSAIAARLILHCMWHGGNGANIGRIVRLLRSAAATRLKHLKHGFDRHIMMKVSAFAC